MIGVQDEDAVHRPRHHRIGRVFLARHGKAHLQEVRRIVERIGRIHERLTDRVLVGHGCERRHLGDHANRSDQTLIRIGDVSGVVIECRERTNRSDHDGHRVSGATEALQEAAHLLVDHRVVCHTPVKVSLLCGCGQFAEQQQIAGLEEVAVFGELLDRIAAMQQDAFVAIDISDLRLAACGRGEAGVIGEHPRLPIELGDIHHIGADRSGFYRQVPAFVADRDLCDLGIRLRVHNSFLCAGTAVESGIGS